MTSLAHSISCPCKSWDLPGMWQQLVYPLSGSWKGFSKSHIKQPSVTSVVACSDFYFQERSQPGVLPHGQIPTSSSVVWQGAARSCWKQHLLQCCQPCTWEGCRTSARIVLLPFPEQFLLTQTLSGWADGWGLPQCLHPCSPSPVPKGWLHWPVPTLAPSRWGAQQWQGTVFPRMEVG